MHPRVLHEILHSALAAATGVCVAGCQPCAFGGNPYGPYGETFLERVPAGTINASGPIDERVCAGICGPNVTSCERVELPPKPKTVKLDCVCSFAGENDRWRKSIEVPMPTPDESDASSCKSCCAAGESKPITVASCEREYSPAPALDPGDTLVVCRLRQPGGCTGWSGGGRPPRGLVPPSGHARDVAGFFARMAYFERASVAAFVELADALVAMGAPRSLVRRARRSAQDEARHARAMTAIAQSRGGVVERPRRRALGARAAVDLARENAVEGCVHETLGALLALRQATHARDAGVRAAMTEIARDEIRHAALSWDVHRFLVARLDDTARADVRAAMRAAVDRAPYLDVAANVREAVGLPWDDEARALVATLRESLWDRAPS